MTELAWASSGGGPLLAIDGALAAAWRGVRPPVGARVPEGWSWGDGGIRCDYDRACDDMDDVVTTGDLVHTWSVPVADGRALVLDGETATTAMPWDGGVLLARNVPVALGADDLAAMARAIPSDAWAVSSHVIPIASGRLFVFDSAATGDADPEAMDADGVVVVETAPGRYRARFAASGPAESDPTVLILLGREA